MHSCDTLFPLCPYKCFHVTVHLYPYCGCSRRLPRNYQSSVFVSSKCTASIWRESCSEVVYCCHFTVTDYHKLYHVCWQPYCNLCFGFRLKLGCISQRFRSILWIVCVQFYVIDASLHAVSLFSSGSVCVPLGHWSEGCM